MARPLARTSDWANRFIEDEPIEGEYQEIRSDLEDRAAGIVVRIGALCSILIGLALTIVGSVSILGIAMVPIGIALIIVGIRRAQG